MNWDRFKSSLADIIEDLVGARLDYLARYPARVVKQDVAGRLELIADDARLPPLAGVPIRTPFPGQTITVSPGARVLVAFEAGSPEKPVAELWESGSPLTIVLACPSVTLTGTLAAGAVVSAGLAAPSGSNLELTVDGIKKVLLAGGGQGVARIGDTVQVDPGSHMGTITGGSTKVEAG